MKQTRFSEDEHKRHNTHTLSHESVKGVRRAGESEKERRDGEEVIGHQSKIEISRSFRIFV